MALTLSTVLANALPVRAKPSGNYVDPADGNIYYYDSGDESLTYVEPCTSANGCAFTDTANQNGECTYSGAWQTGGTYLGLGACASVEAVFSSPNWQLKHREDVREVSTSCYQWRTTRIWRDIFNVNVGSPIVSTEDAGCGVGVALKGSSQSYSTSSPPTGAIKICGKTEILKGLSGNYAVYRTTSLVCSG